MARTARQKLRDLRIPESDAAWEHVKFRTTANPPGIAAASSSGVGLSSLRAGVQSEPKRGVTSKEAREKKARPKPDPKAQIRMKDESIRAAPRPSTAEVKPRDLGGASASSSKPIVRKPPGSGFRVGHSASQDGRSDTAEPSSSNTLSRKKLVDTRANKDRDPPSTSSLHSSPRPIQKEGKSSGVTQPQRIKKIKESGGGGGGGGTDSERERLSASIKEKPRFKQRDDRDRLPAEDREGSLKRKKTPRDGDDYDATVSRSAPQKKRRTENSSVHAMPTSTPREPKSNESPLPPKPELAPPSRSALKKDYSPLPAPATLPRIKKDSQPRPPPLEVKPSPQESASSSSSAQGRKANIVAKSRRRSPVYTTSEDESDPHRPTRDAGPLPTPPLTTDYTASTTHPNPQSRPRTKDPRPLPTDHAALRARYHSSYREYLATFQKLVAQKGKLDSMLISHEVGSAESITDSDGDVELLETEELMKLKSDHARLKDELTTIREIFTP
jgi:RNA polymerase II elongation factor ELL